MTKLKVKLLCSAAEYVKVSGNTVFKKTDLLGSLTHTEYANFQKLRYHALIAKAKDENKQNIKGTWLITKRGWAFLAHRELIPSSVWVKDNKVVEHSEEMVSAQMVWRDAPYFETEFEYRAGTIVEDNGQVAISIEG